MPLMARGNEVTVWTGTPQPQGTDSGTDRIAVGRRRVLHVGPPAQADLAVLPRPSGASPFPSLVPSTPSLPALQRTGQPAEETVSHPNSPLQALANTSSRDFEDGAPPSPPRERDTQRAECSRELVYWEWSWQSYQRRERSSEDEKPSQWQKSLLLWAVMECSVHRAKWRLLEHLGQTGAVIVFYVVPRLTFSVRQVTPGDRCVQVGGDVRTHSPLQRAGNPRLPQGLALG